MGSGRCADLNTCRIVAINSPVWYTGKNFIYFGTERTVTMEFHEKLQELRKRKGLTQEELAEALYVSRAAVSKWESGRGYPNLDSLKAIAKLFSVTIDELLSGDEVLSIAEEDGREQKNRLLDRVFGILDCSAVMFLLLPLFGQRSVGMVQGVSLLSLAGIAPWLRTAYYVLVFGMVAVGVLTLVLRSGGIGFWTKNKRIISLLLNAAGEILFILARQPYAAVLLLVFLGIKALLLTKQP